MNIKAIVVDMDGTFLNEQHDYNHERFEKQYARLKEQGIQFVVASGRQYYALLPYFKHIAEEITFIADNGTQMFHQGQEVFVQEMPRERVDQMITLLLDAGLNNYVLSGRKGTYINAVHMTPERQKYVEDFVDNIQIYRNLDEVDDKILKFGICVETDENAEKLWKIIEHSDGAYEAVGSGYGFMDVLTPGISKGAALRRLQRAYGYDDDEVVIFGDSNNDMSMLRGRKFSFAMRNAAEEVKECANYHAPSNEEEGVLEVVDRLLEQKEPFAC